MRNALFLVVLVLVVSLVSSLNLFQSKKVIPKVSASDLKNQIFTLAKNTKNGVNANDKTKNDIAQLVAQLEKINPTKDLTTTKKIDGDWRLLYTTNEGSSAGKLGPFVGKVNQIMDFKEKKYINTVNIFNILVASLYAVWNKKSDKTWEVTFKSIEFKVFGNKIVEKPLSAVGIWRKSYIDDDFRVLYAKGGKNVEKENIYILFK